MAVVFSVVLGIIEDNIDTGEAALEYMESAGVEERDATLFWQYYKDNGCPIVLKPAAAIVSFGMDRMDNKGNVFAFIFAAFFLQGLVYAVPITFLIAFLIYRITLRNNTKLVKELQDKVGDATEQRNDMVYKIKDYICYVPPAFRTSDALSYFVNAYRNTKVSNLKEAVNSYSDADATAKICRELDCIKAIQLHNSAQIAHINSEVWREDYIF